MAWSKQAIYLKNSLNDKHAQIPYLKPKIRNEDIEQKSTVLWQNIPKRINWLPKYSTIKITHLSYIIKET